MVENEIQPTPDAPTDATAPKKEPTKKAAPKKAAPKKEPAKKAAPKKAAPKKEPAKKAAPKMADVTGDVHPEEKPELPEKDVKTAVAEINATIKELDSDKVVKTWDVGAKLRDLRERCTPPQFAAIVLERIIGPDGDPKGKAWCYQAVKMATLVTRPVGVKMGMGRMIQIFRLKTPEEMHDALDGLPVLGDDGTELLVKPWTMSVKKLKAYITDYLHEKYPPPKLDPQDVVIQGLQKIQGAFLKFQEEHAHDIKKYKFSAEHIEFVENFKLQVEEFLGVLVLAPTKEATEVLAAKAELDVAGEGAVA